MRRIVAVLALTVLIAPASAEAKSLKHLKRTYTDVRHSVRKQHGVKAVGRNILRQGLRVRRHGHWRTREARRSDYRRSIAIMKRWRPHYTSLLGPGRPYTPPTYAATPRTVGAPLSAIRACESTNNYSAVSPDGKYRGAYQFDQGTWASVGGTGDPAAASPAEQDKRAAILYSRRGSAPWPVCGR